MARLVIVSNRVPSPRERGTLAGGLAVALREAIQGRETLWFGWSGHVRGGRALPALTQMGGVTYATVDLTEAEHRGYYLGFANATLWPLLHWRLGLAEFRREDLATYREVNDSFAASVAPLLRSDDVIWAHDYHLIPFGAALRRLRPSGRLGFFLHVPFPPAALFRTLPEADALLRDLSAYDVIGLQTRADAANLNEALEAVGAKGRAEAFPVGIDPASFAETARRAAASTETHRLADSLPGRALILGVDRLDYSKGLPQRFRGFDQLLRRFPEHRGRVTYLQVAPLSRGDVAQYRALRRELDELAGRINGQHTEVDWVPLRWITRTVPRNTLAGYHRLARVGLVTPLRDGMNLVAKEFVAAQDPNDPGALVLSRFAGVAEELDAGHAMLVNPYDPDEIAEALDQALTMSREERLRRWRAMGEVVWHQTAAAWSRSFMARLEGRRVVTA